MPTDNPTLPLIILGGSDRKPSDLPPEGRGKHALSGCKAVDIHIDGRRLIEVVVDRFKAAGSFHPIYIAGPAVAYAKTQVDSEVFDTDEGFGRNIQVGIDEARKRHPEGELAMATCDILPTEDDLKTLLDDYREHAPSDLWFPMIEAPQDARELGESSWKPRYQIRDGEEGERTVPVLPGHMAIFDPEAMRLQFLYRLLDLGYQSRNRPILYRRSFLIRQLFFRVLWQDALHLLSFRLPTFTWDTLRTGGGAALKLRNNKMTRVELEEAMRKVFSRRAHRKEHPERRIRMPILQALSIARDIDTLEEAAEMGAQTC
ncbi:MAG: hypothetical protein AAF690_16620 [Acidobacteriota bacterium]